MGRLDIKEVIGIFAIAVPAVLNVILFALERVLEKANIREVSKGAIEGWKRQSLCMRIVLHRVAAIATASIVFILILVSSSQARFILGFLFGVIGLEVFLFFKHVRYIGKSGRTNQRLGWAHRIAGFIDDRFDLKYSRNEYPISPLLVEAIALVYLCIVSGGISSPFIPLFVYFCALMLYVSFSCRLRETIVYVIALCLCYLFIFYLVGIQASETGKGFATLELVQLSIRGDETYVFVGVFFYSTLLCGLLFLGIMEHSVKLAKESAKLAEERDHLPIEQTKMILRTNKVHDWRFGQESQQVFIIGNRSTFDPDKAIALLPYCSRAHKCPIRLENSKRPLDAPVDGGDCEECDEACPIGKIKACRIGGKPIRIRVIGTSHNMGPVLENFRKDHELNHVIAVCCTSNLAEYFPKYFGRSGFEHTTVIYTPLLEGTEKCLSSLDAGRDERGLGELPFTRFDADALIRTLEAIPKAT